MKHRANDAMSKALESIPEAKRKAREQAVDLLKNFFDNESFIELDSMLSFANSTGEYQNIGAGVICACGKINGRLVYVIRQLGSNGGAVSSTQVKKINKTVKKAVSAGAPIVSFFDSSGADLKEGSELLLSYAKLMRAYGRAKGVVPLISVVMGSCYGANALLAKYADFTIGLRNGTGLFLIGEAEIDEKTSENYGSAEQISIFGACDVVCDDEISALKVVKRILSFMPGSRFEKALRYEIPESVELDESISSIANDIEAGNPYDMKTLLTKFVDYEDILFFSENFGKRACTGFGRIGGISIGIVSNLLLEKESEPVLDFCSLEKINRFIKICDNFNIPILSVVDVAGFTSKDEEEALNLLKSTTDISRVLSSIDVPFVSLIVGRAYGSSYLSMGVKNQSANMTFAWGNSKISLIEPKAGALIFEQDSIDAKLGDVLEQRKKIIDDFIDNNCSVEIAAASGLIDDIIEPIYTRYRLVDVFDSLQSKLSEQTLKKLGF